MSCLEALAIIVGLEAYRLHALAQPVGGFVGGAGRGALAPTQQYTCIAFLIWRRLWRAEKSRAVGVHEDPKRPRRTHDEPGGLSVTPVPVGLWSHAKRRQPADPGEP